jgi:hypothetical protein
MVLTVKKTRQMPQKGLFFTGKLSKPGQLSFLTLNYLAP